MVARAAGAVSDRRSVHRSRVRASGRPFGPFVYTIELQAALELQVGMELRAALGSRAALGLLVVSP